MSQAVSGMNSAILSMLAADSRPNDPIVRIGRVSRQLTGANIFEFIRAVCHHFFSYNRFLEVSW